MTGLYTANNAEVYEETLEERYQKTKRSVTSLAPLQIGICLWRREQDRLVATPYTFHLFPAQREFVVQSSAFEFLSSHNFDFNKGFCSGIPYMNISQAERSYTMKPFLSEKDQLLVNKHMEDLQSWLNQSKQETKFFIQEPSGYTRYLLYSNLAKLGNVRVGSVNDVIEISRISDDESNQIQREKWNQYLEKEAPFRKVATMLIDAKKPLIGHNCFLDIFHFYQHFYEDLPDTLEEFKTNWTKIFPEVYDTKVLSLETRLFDSFVPMNQRHLERLYTHVTSNFLFARPEISMDPDCISSSSGAHNAGYDAMMTGALFARLFAVDKPINQITIDQDYKTKYLNRVNLMKSPHPFKFTK
jgi:poly(A)-specific ribonuclease